MKLLLVWLLLASLCPPASRMFSVSSGAPAWVTQSPDVSVPEGDTVTISCCWTLEAERLKVTWLKNGTTLNSTLITADRPQQSSNCSGFTLTEVSQEDSGSYRCRVLIEIPANSFSALEGNGTVVAVEAKGGWSPAAVPPEWRVSLLVSLLVLVLVLVTLTTVYLRRHKQALAARVIYEVPHCDSEPADVEQRSSGSSEGSSKWCQVPVYESFDYFEGLQEGGTK